MELTTLAMNYPVMKLFLIPRVRRNLVIGAMSAAISAPAILFAALGYSNVIYRFIGFLVGGFMVIGVLSATWFSVACRFMQRSRWGLVRAGCLSAVLTCFSFIAIYSILTSYEGQGPWVSGFLLYSIFSFYALLPLILLGGMLVGWVAGMRWLAD